MAQQSFRNMQRGMQFMEGEQYNYALQEFGRAAAENPNSPLPHVFLGSALYWSGKVDEAMAEYNLALKFDPKNNQAHQLMGIAYAWKGDGDKALASFMTAAQYAPQLPDIQMNIGSIYEAMNEYGRALIHFRKAVALSPRHPLYNFQLGVLYTRLGRDEDAVDSLKAAISAFPEYEDAMLELGAAYERLGKPKDALGLYKKAVRVKPRDSVARFRYARLLTLMNKNDDAAEVVKDAFSLLPNKQGEGLALTVAYSGMPSQSSDDRKESEPKTPVDALKHNLEKIPSDQRIKVTAELMYVPKPKLEKKEDRSERTKKSSLKNALGKTLNQQGAMAIRREFVMAPTNDAERGEQIRQLVSELEKSIKQAPPDTDMKMALNMETQSDDSNPRPSSSMEASSGGRVTFDPRAVGNDMGLWVVGKAWVDLINEVLPDFAKDTGDSSSSARLLVAGLGHIILGEPDKALSFFEKIKSGPDMDGRHLGAAVAWVESGGEDRAVTECEKALKANPKSAVAAENLKWLKMPPAKDDKKK